MDRTPTAPARSWLFVPGDRPERFAKPARAGADVTILDLEDGVAEADKDTARSEVSAWLSPEHPVYVRVNGPSTARFAADFEAVNRLGLAGILVPKTGEPDTVADIAGRLADDVAVVPLVETALGVWNVRELAGVPKVERLAFGSIDLQLDAGIDGDDQELLYARSRLVLASRVARVRPPIDGITPTISDDDRLAADVDRARRLGFTAKLCIHPNQIRTVNNGFAPSPAEVAWARRVLDAIETPGPGARQVDGELIDRPVISRAESIWRRIVPAD